MTKKYVSTPRKSPRLIEANSMNESTCSNNQHIDSNPRATNNEILTKDNASPSKISQAKKTVSHANQKEKERKVKIIEATHSNSNSDSNFVSEI